MRRPRSDSFAPAEFRWWAAAAPMPVPPPVISACRPSSIFPIHSAWLNAGEVARRGRMKLAILETGRPPGTLASQFGDYAGMFGQLLGPEFEVESFDVEGGELPRDPSAHGAYLITGSPAGVYDPLPWIAPLMDFIRAAQDARMVGICFGHQVMAEALGGHVEKSNKGWGAGLHQYQVVADLPWMDGASEIAVPASHQDQVVVQPPNTEVTTQSAFTSFAG